MAAAAMVVEGRERWPRGPLGVLVECTAPEGRGVEGLWRVVVEGEEGEGRWLANGGGCGCGGCSGGGSV